MPPPPEGNLADGTGLSEDGLELSLMFMFNPLGNPFDPFGGNPVVWLALAARSSILAACCCC